MKERLPIALAFVEESGTPLHIFKRSFKHAVCINWSKHLYHTLHTALFHHSKEHAHEQQVKISKHVSPTESSVAKPIGHASQLEQERSRRTTPLMSISYHPLNPQNGEPIAEHTTLH